MSAEGKKEEGKKRKAEKNENERKAAGPQGRRAAGPQGRKFIGPQICITGFKERTFKTEDEGRRWNLIFQLAFTSC